MILQRVVEPSDILTTKSIKKGEGEAIPHPCHRHHPCAAEPFSLGAYQLYET
jgi:hypothetical protein